jgi:arabinofuranan 3-O-arabinosyltransferase
MVSTWFRPGAFVDGGDVGPFIRGNLAGEIGSLWNHQATGAGSPSYQIDQLAEVALLKACAMLGWHAPFAQYLFYCVVAASASAATSYLAAVWIRSPWAVAFAGVAALSNAFMLVNMPNPMPLIALGTVAFLGGSLLRRAAGHRSSLFAFVLGTLPLGALGMNPPLVAIVILTVCGIALGAGPLTAGRTRPALGLLARVVVPATLANAWWLVPEALTLLDGTTSVAAQTDITQLAWVQVRQSIPDVLSLNTSWPWPDPLNFPFAGALDRLPWWPLQWLLPALALVGLLGVPRTAATLRRRTAAIFAGLLVLLCLLSKGTHAPFADINLWMYRNVPGMWLFREPMQKFGVIIVLVYAVAAGSAVASFSELAKGLPRRGLLAAGAGAVATAVAALAYPLPLWNGDLTGEAHGRLPSATVRIPDAWYRIAETVNTSPVPGKALELPLPAFYMNTTSWGYHGVDLVPQQLLTRPLVRELPGGYFSGSDGYLRSLSDLQATLVSGSTSETNRLLTSLGITQVILRHDLPDIDGQLTADPRALSAGLAADPAVRLSGRSDVADSFDVPGDAMLTMQPSSGATWVRDTPSHYRVSGRPAATPSGTAHLTITLAEAYAPGWQLQGLPEGWSARHFSAAGYANSWDVQGPGAPSLHLTLAFGPDAWGRLAQSISALTLAVSAAAWGLLTLRRRGSRPGLRALLRRKATLQ